jgi:hypothetical protein
MYDINKSPNNYELIKPGSPQETVAEQKRVIEGAVFNVYQSIRASRPHLLTELEQIPAAPMAAAPESQLEVPAVVAGSAALGESVERDYTQHDGPTILEDDPIYNMTQEMFIDEAQQEADIRQAREATERAYGNDSRELLDA